MNDILEEVRAERAHQDEKWGGPAHDDCHEIEDWRTFLLWRVSGLGLHGTEQTRRLLVETAALAVAAIESLDRLNAELGR